MNLIPKLQAHRGVSTECPENTMAAFRAAAAQGYDIIELDPGYTLDRQLVVLHDETVNRTARRSDGTSPEQPVRLCDISLSQAQEYDYGSFFSPKFRGEPLPLLEQALQFASESGLGIKLDNKIRRFPPDVCEKLYALIRKYGQTVQLTAADPDTLEFYARAFPAAALHYDSPVDKPLLQRLAGFGDRLTVWLPFFSPLTAWAKVPFADYELCNAVRNCVKMGIWLIGDEDSFDTVCRDFAPDIVETNGAVKPRRNRGLLCDMHVHTVNSHDSTCPTAEMADAALQKGIDILAITDHSDIQYYYERNIPGRIANSAAEAAAENDRLSGKVRILRGIEMGESVWFPHYTREILSVRDYDVVLASVHAARFGSMTDPYSSMDFTDMPQQIMEAYLEQYFEEVYETACVLPCDILCHLTCPWRYIEGKFRRSIDLFRYEPQITRILKLIIARGIALELNTSGIRGPYGEFMPTEWILAKYRQLGGYLVTLGSDAHVSAHLGHGLDQGIALLKRLGFRHYFYYVNRIAIQCSI